jgi:hypothetical protein
MLLEIDDDRGGGTLSLIRGAVPASGMLTFAVTGFGDTEFLGTHEQAGDYVLELTIEQGGLRGDYNGNGIVDAADYPVWRDTLGQTGAGLAADGDGDSEIGAGDYTVWKAQFGETAAGGVNAAVNVAVPEPECWLLVALGVGCLLARCP